MPEQTYTDDLYAPYSPEQEAYLEAAYAQIEDELAMQREDEGYEEP